MRFVSHGRIGIFVILVVLLEIQPGNALNPRFELDLKTLRSGSGPVKPEQTRSGSARMPSQKGRGGSVARSAAVPSPTNLKRVERTALAGKRVAATPKGGSGGAGHPGFASRKRGGTVRSGTVAARHHLSMQSPASGPQDGVRWARQVWERLGAADGDAHPLLIEGKNFSLSLDPAKFPLFSAADGSRIILDADRSLTPLVKAVIMEQDPAVRFVSENPADRKQFFRSLFAAAGFYSIEEGFAVSFGTDPKVTVLADFKVEKNPESLSNGEIFLVNVAAKGGGNPGALHSFLENEGFRMVDATPPPTVPYPDGRHVLYSIRGGSRESMTDSLLKALAIEFDRDRNLELDDGAASGVKLVVRADRYHEDRAGRVVVSFAEADSVQHTLLRLLELQGYKVVMLYPEDDFRKVTEKLLSVFRVPATYGMHRLWNPGQASYDVQLSGFALGGDGLRPAGVVLTNVVLDPLVKELAALNGYDLVER